MLAIAMLAAYTVGAIPFSAIAARLKGIDLRVHGSGNLGATNAIRVLGPGLGVPVLLADILKGVFAAAAVPAFFGLFDESGRLLCAAAAVIGHTFPVFARFKGGKGVATAGGAFLTLAPVGTGIALAVFVVALLVGRYVSLASVLAAVTLPMAVWTTGGSTTLRIAALATAVLVVIRHRTNLDRLRRGTESRVPLGKPKS